MNRLHLPNVAFDDAAHDAQSSSLEVEVTPAQREQFAHPQAEAHGRNHHKPEMRRDELRKKQVKLLPGYPRLVDADTVYANGGYQGTLLDWATDTLGMRLSIIKRTLP